MDKRITELEIRLTHNEHTLEILDRTVIEQHRLIDQLQLHVSILEKKLKAVARSLACGSRKRGNSPAALLKNGLKLNFRDHCVVCAIHGP